MDIKRLDIHEMTLNYYGAPLYKAKDAQEGFYHVCDGVIFGCMPEIFIHDVHARLYMDNKAISIKYCPLCGVQLG